jgi:CheY-like chemotaxis protein
MSAEVKSQATEPFFSTKPPESGVGLGLTLVAACARNHRGAVELDSEASGGTTVSLYLPLHASPSAHDLETLFAPERRVSPAASRTTRAAEAATPPATERVALFVDDEPLMQETGRRLLDKLGFKVDLASDGVEAFEAYSRNPKRYALIVLDVSLPRMSGVEVLERVLEREPEMKVLLITGHPTLPVTPAVLAKPNVYVLQKPFSIQEVKLAIERLLHPK